MIIAATIATIATTTLVVACVLSWLRGDDPALSRRVARALAPTPENVRRDGRRNHP